MNNVPRNVYPTLVRYMNGRQIAQLASSSKNFYNWLHEPNQFRVRAKMYTKRHRNIVSSLPTLAQNNRNFLRQYNIPKWRAQAYLRSQHATNKPPMRWVETTYGKNRNTMHYKWSPLLRHELMRIPGHLNVTTYFPQTRTRAQIRAAANRLIHRWLNRVRRVAHG